MLRLSLSMDTQEAIVWGKYCLWGTTKHPPFSGWIAYTWYMLFGQNDNVMYALSQIFVILGVVYIYKLAQCFLNKIQSVMAAALQFGIIYYGFSAPEFNVNVISVGLWPMCAYYFWRGYTQNRWRDWLLFGVLVGLNLLSKYVGAMLLIALGIFAISDRNTIKLIKNIKIYGAIFTAVLLLAPHLWWLWQNDFESFNYISSRSHGGDVTSVWRHIIYPLKFLGAQILFATPALLTFVYFWRRNQEKTELPAPRRLKLLKDLFISFACTRNDSYNTQSDASAARFIFCTAIIPVAVFATICLITGNAAKSMWGFPCLFMWGTALFYFLPPKVDENTAERFLNIMFVWVALFAFAYGVQCVVTTSQRYRTDVRQVAATLEQKWQQHTGKPLEYVGADVWFGDIMALYASHEIKPMIWMKPKSNPWFNQADFEQKGALLIASEKGEYANYQKMYGNRVSAPQKMMLEFQNYFGKTKTKEIIYGFYEPWEVENAEKE